MVGIRATTALFVSISVAAASNSAVPTGLKGKSYDIARAELVRAGFQPVHFQRGPLFEPCPDDPSSCKRYPETIGCSGTGLAYCQFAFFDRRNRGYVIVTTQGEEGRVVVSVTRASRRDRTGWPREVH